MFDRDSFKPRSEEELDHITAIEQYNPEKFAEIQLEFLNFLHDLNVRQRGKDIYKESVEEPGLAERLREDELKWLCPQPKLNPETRLIDLLALGVNPSATAGKLQVTNGELSSLIYETQGGVQVSQLFSPNSSETP